MMKKNKLLTNIIILLSSVLFSAFFSGVMSHLDPSLGFILPFLLSTTLLWVAQLVIQVALIQDDFRDIEHQLNIARDLFSLGENSSLFESIRRMVTSAKRATENPDDPEHRGFAELQRNFLQSKLDESAQFSSAVADGLIRLPKPCLLYTSPSPRDRQKSRMPSSA